MNKVLKNMAAGGGVGILFLLQVIVASGTANFLFFPAASLYLATYMTPPFAFVLGVFLGGVWNSVSLAPFGLYALGLGGSMGGVSLYMKLMDERSIAARWFVASLLWGMCTIILGAVYFFLEKESQVIILYGYDSLVGFLILLGVMAGHMVLRKLYRRT